MSVIKTFSIFGYGESATPFKIEITPAGTDEKPQNTEVTIVPADPERFEEARNIMVNLDDLIELIENLKNI